MHVLVQCVVQDITTCIQKNHSSVDGGLVNHNVNITVILSL